MGWHSVPCLHDMPDLTERRLRQTRAEIAEAAIALFSERGFEAVTMEDIAIAAGSSRRTVYRYFPGKEDLVFEHPRRWLQHFDEVVAESRHTSGLDRCIQSLGSIAALIDAAAEAVFATYQVYLNNPSLRAIRGRLDDESFARFYALAEADLPESDDKIITAALIAGTLVGALNGVIAAWVLLWPARSMTDLVQQALARIDPILKST